MSDAPNYSGIPWTKGIYKAVFRAVLTDCTVVTHKVTVTVYGETESMDLYSMDLSLGESTMPKNDQSAFLQRMIPAPCPGDPGPDPPAGGGLQRQRGVCHGEGRGGQGLYLRGKDLL